MNDPDIPMTDDWWHDFLPLNAVGSVENPWEAILQLWSSRRADENLPSWSSFDMYDFKPWLGYVAVYKVEADPFDATTTLWGTGLAEIYGEDRTGKSLRENQAAWSLTVRDWDFWKRVALEPCIGMSEGTIYWQDRVHVRLRRVFLPFAEDGQRCDVIVSASERIAL